MTTLRSCAILFFTITLFVCPLLHAQSAPADMTGIYVVTNKVAGLSPTTAAATDASLHIPGVDGMVLLIGWNTLEPSMGQYDWTLLDQWIGQAVTLGKKIDLSITAGSDTPPWLFQAPPAGAGAAELKFTVSPHGGATGSCDTDNIAAPWDPAFLAQWDQLLANVAAHLKATGTYADITLLRITGINRTTDELRLPAETAASTGLACVSDAISTWQQAGYRPSLLLKAWDAITDSFRKSFPDKTFSIAIIPTNPFPPIAEDGSIIKGTSVDENQPLIAPASQKFPRHLVVQFNFLMPGEPAAPSVVGYAQTLGTLPAFQTNEYFGAKGLGAACSEPVTNPTPCTATTFLQLLETGIFPLGRSNPMRSEYIEVFQANANAFPPDVLTAHDELVATGRRHAARR